MAHVYHSVPRYIRHLRHNIPNPLLDPTSSSSHCYAHQQHKAFVWTRLPQPFATCLSHAVLALRGWGNGKPVFPWSIDMLEVQES